MAKPRETATLRAVFTRGNPLNPTTHTDRTKPLLLIVDDDDNQRALYEEEMRDEGYDVVTAADGREALKVAGENHPDLVVMDVNMPVMDGLDTLSRMIEVDRHVPIIIHTAYASYQDSFASWSADAYIVKSGDLSNLKNSVRELLAARGGNANENANANANTNTNA